MNKSKHLVPDRNDIDNPRNIRDITALLQAPPLMVDDIRFSISDIKSPIVDVKSDATFACDTAQFLQADFLLNSTDAWEADQAERFNLPVLNASFRESVPALKLLDWEILDMRRGYAETRLPLNVNSSNQYITHQAALQLVAADYTGGLAMASLFHLAPVIGFWESKDDQGIYMWGAMATIKWHAPSCDDLICRSSVPKENWNQYLRRLNNHQQVAPTLQIDMYNGRTRVAEAQFTYWAQDIEGLRKNAFDPQKVNVLYLHKTKTTAKLIAGLRALEYQKPLWQRLCSDPYAPILAGKHGITLAQRFQQIIPELQRMVAARTCHLDMTARAFVRNHPQGNVVNIGAGYDARFWRLDGVDALNIYELDLPIMLNERRKMFMYDKKPNMHCVPVDLRSSTIAQVLEAEPSFNGSMPTLYIWEGGSMYFDGVDAEKIFSSFAALTAQCSDSLVWFDYVTKNAVGGCSGIDEIDRFNRSMSKMGEPFIHGINDICAYSKEHQLRIIDDTSCANYLGIHDTIDQQYHFCTLKA